MLNSNHNLNIARVKSILSKIQCCISSRQIHNTMGGTPLIGSPAYVPVGTYLRRADVYYSTYHSH